VKRVQTITLPIEGMTCASCVARVEKALLRVNGVESASANLASERVTITFDGEQATVDQLSHAIQEAGYALLMPPLRNRIGILLHHHQSGRKSRISIKHTGC